MYNSLTVRDKFNCMQMIRARLFAYRLAWLLRYYFIFDFNIWYISKAKFLLPFIFYSQWKIAIETLFKRFEDLHQFGMKISTAYVYFFYIFLLFYIFRYVSKLQPIWNGWRILRNCLIKFE